MSITEAARRNPKRSDTFIFWWMIAMLFGGGAFVYIVSLIAWHGFGPAMAALAIISGSAFVVLTTLGIGDCMSMASSDATPQTQKPSGD